MLNNVPVNIEKKKNTTEHAHNNLVWIYFAHMKDYSSMYGTYQIA